MLLAAAKVWTYWVSWVLLAVVALVIAATVIGYWVRVTSRKAPRP